MADQKIAVITGATSGIGRWIALGVARAGYHVVMIARDAGRGTATQQWIAERARGASTEVVLADLSSLVQTRTAAAAIAERNPRIDLLVNNAGLITAHREVTSEGHERILAVNHLAPFVLTGALEWALRDAAPARVVNVGSASSDRVSSLDIDDLEGERRWQPLRAYGQSKLAIMMVTFERARRLAGTGVDVNVVHPGVVSTEIGAVPGLIGFGWSLLRPFMIKAEQGADTPLHMALASELAGTTGVYFKKRQPVRPNCLALDRALVTRLWDETVRLAG
jgi:NAD(P)-dependent dehydrogenase (short-subunit alcohol dehydrogenase family)